MEIAKIQFEQRTARGRHQIARLRAGGSVPAIVYGGGSEPLPVSVSEQELDAHLRHHHRVFEMDLGGRRDSLILHEIQWDVTTDRPLHVDFKRIDLTKPVEVLVEITLLGHAAGLSKGGRMIHDHDQILLRCLPTAIPDTIEVKVDHLEIGDGVRAKELVLPAGVELAVEPDTMVCHVAMAIVQAAPEPAPAAEGAVPAEGAAPEAAATPGATPAGKGAPVPSAKGAPAPKG